MSEQEKKQAGHIMEAFSKMSNSQKAIFCAYGDGMLAASEIHSRETGENNEQPDEVR